MYIGMFVAWNQIVIVEFWYEFTYNCLDFECQIIYPKLHFYSMTRQDIDLEKIIQKWLFEMTKLFSCRWDTCQKTWIFLKTLVTFKKLTAWMWVESRTILLYILHYKNSMLGFKTNRNKGIYAKAQYLKYLIIASKIPI